MIGTSAIIDTEIDGAVGMNSGIYNKKKLFRYYLTISFQFHHTQMDGAHAGKFLANLQNEINGLQVIYGDKTYGTIHDGKCNEQQII